MPGSSYKNLQTQRWESETVKEKIWFDWPSDQLSHNIKQKNVCLEEQESVFVPFVMRNVALLILSLVSLSKGRPTKSSLWLQEILQLVQYGYNQFHQMYW